MHKLSISRKWILLVIVLAALAAATPVLADYLGPNRVVTTTVSVCHAVLYECKEVNGHWKYKRIEDWSCPNGAEACAGYDDHAKSCEDGAAVNGHQYCSREETTETITTVLPEATIGGAVNCTVQNGWCNGGSVPELALSANEPVAGQSILLIEGMRNGESFACQNGMASCNVPMVEGDNSFNYWALSSWGDSSQMGSASARVDTIPPDVGLSLSGQAGNQGWYRSALEVTVSGSDATSGVATLEVAADGGGYQMYAPVTFSDGRHTLQIRAMDNAGNLFEAPLQNFYVDTIPPTIDVRAAWYLGRDVPYRAYDEGSGLAALRIVIEDEDEKYGKVSWEREARGASYESHLDWDGQFRDGVSAGPGTYLVWFKASDVAGNERIQLAKVVVPEPEVALSSLPTEPAVATDVPVVPPAELSNPGTAALVTDPSASAGAAGTGATTTTTQTVLLTSGSAGVANSTTTTSSGILWGAAAAAAIAAATAYALEETRKRQEAEEAQAAAVRAQIAHDKEEREKKKEKQRENYEKQKALQDAIDAYHE